MAAAMVEAAMAEAAVATATGSATAAAGSAAAVLGCAAGRRIGGAPVREGGGGLDGGGDVGGGGGGDGGRGDDGPDLQTRGAWREHVVWGQRRVARQVQRFKSRRRHLSSTTQRAKNDSPDPPKWRHDRWWANGTPLRFVVPSLSRSSTGAGAGHGVRWLRRRRRRFGCGWRQPPRCRGRALGATAALHDPRGEPQASRAESRLIESRAQTRRWTVGVGG